MAIALNNGAMPEPAAATVEAVAVTGAPTAAPADPFGLFKEKFGYETPEAAVQDITALRAFREAPPTAELKFENEQSRQLAEAIQGGKLQDVYQVLDQQMRIDRLTAGELTHEVATELVKYGMQLRYKDLTPAEINYKFNKQFAVPPKPALLPAEDQEEYNQRVTNWERQKADIEMDLMIEAKQSRPDLLNAKAKLVFPSISRPQDAEFQEWQKTVQENERLSAETTQAYKALTPKSIETKLNFVDEPNKIAFDFSYEPDADSFKEAQEMVSDINLFWKRYIGPDGTPDRQGFLKGIYHALNHDKIVLEAIKQTKNATIKAGLPDNSTGGMVRQLPQGQQASELDTMMRASLKGYGGY